MSAVINISYAHSTICCCFYCIHISFFIITLQRYVLFPTPPNFSPFFSSAINNQQSIIIHHSSTTYPLPFAPPRPRRTNTRTSCVKQSRLCCVKQSQFYCVKQSQFYCVKQSQFYCVKQPRATPLGACACLRVQAQPARL